jgi:hypothetical protein
LEDGGAEGGYDVDKGTRNEEGIYKTKDGICGVDLEAARGHDTNQTATGGEPEEGELGSAASETGENGTGAG